MKRESRIKRKKNASAFGSLLLGLIAIVLLGIFLAYNLNKTNKNLENWSRYAIIGKNNVIVVYEDKLAIKIPFDVQVDKDTTIKDLVNSKNYELVLNSINSFLPEKISNYKVMKYSDISLNVKNARNIPEMVIDDKKYILTSGTQSLFSDLYGGELKNSQNLVVDILNANGIGGYARKTGENLKENLSDLTYTAANYEKNEEYSLIKINEIDKENLEKILMSVNEKYFKIKEDNNIPTLASVVLILGKENNIDFKIVVKGTTAQAKNVQKELEASGYKNISLKNEKKDLSKPVIEYNKDDYYIALKISKELKIPNMLENNDLRNKINVLIN
ncbi:LytR family transcriptional regulator [uncultured Cetobacterium sp.]|uniref:LytR family transcriptional regulator n=1 Tax=uncultured Cetobacterium sp. TaxID=527638 RepID=UPI00260EC2E1|nr:LytR family transcriptional regulator [uncultured Cetobacterium sp.]